MENPCTIACFGDSLLQSVAPVFAERLQQQRPSVRTNVINAAVGGETSRDGLQRVQAVVAGGPDVVVIGFGMNDRAKGVTTLELAGNLARMIEACEGAGCRVLLTTVNPVRDAPAGNQNERIDAYNQVIRDTAWEKRVKVVEVARMWKRALVPWTKGLADDLHPNAAGIDIYCRALLQTVPRRSTILLWQYNGNPCLCNYACPYCSYHPREQKGHHFKGTIEKWRDAFRTTFGRQRLVFYLAHGEPMVGERFYDVLDMIGGEPNWTIRMTSNVSQPLERLVETRVAREKRLDINASFHPHMTRREAFLDQILFLKSHGIETPVVYVMYPPLLERFEDDFRAFSERGFMVYAMRFQGMFKGKRYPQAYSDEQRRMMARYMDSTTIKYMLSWQPSEGKRSWSGVDFLVVSNDGDIGLTDAVRAESRCLGNLFDGTFRPATEPQPFPAGGGSEHTVDGVANFVELRYRQLDEGNNVIAFAEQGGIRRQGEGFSYPHMHTDFTRPAVRAEFYFPPRSLWECLHVLACKGRPWETRWHDVKQFVLPEALQSEEAWWQWRARCGANHPRIRSAIRRIRGAGNG